jgi:hypothetical protein
MRFGIFRKRVGLPFEMRLESDAGTGGELRTDLFYGAECFAVGV